MKLGVVVGLGLGRIVLDHLDGSQLRPKKGTTPNLPLGMEVGLGPDDVELDGD